MLQQLQLQHFGVCLQIAADFINQLPFFVPATGMREFQSFNTLYQALPTTACCTITNAAHGFVQSMLTDAIAKIKIDSSIIINGTKINIRAQFITLAAMQVELYQLSVSASSANDMQHYGFLKQALEKQLATILDLIASLRAGLSKTILLKDVTPANTVGKALQHELYHAKQRQLDFSCIYTEPKTTTTPTDKCIPKAQYLDLMLLTYLLQPEKISDGLANKLNIVQSNNAPLEEKISKLKLLPALNLLKIVRLQRITFVYVAWHRLLQEKLTKLTANDLTAALVVQQLLTYEKKAMFNALFKTHTVAEIINAIDRELSEHHLRSASQDEITAHFVNAKQRSQNKVTVIETKLKANQTYTQAIIATAILGVTKQPEYQLGQLAASSTVDIFDQFPQIPIIGPQLPPGMLNNLSHAVGATFLSIALYAANRVGYSYELIAFVNRILLSQINVLIKLGSYGEQINSYIWEPLLEAIRKILPRQTSFAIDWLKEASSVDELGIIEKDKFITWLAGLGIQASTAIGHNVVPAMLGYATGTAVGETTSTIVETCAESYDIDENVTIVTKTIAHIMAYSYAYRYAYTFGTEWLSGSPTRQAFTTLDPSQHALAVQPRYRPTDGQDFMPQRQAFEILGLGQYATKRELKQRFRELTTQYSPDKCKVNCQAADSKMMDINAAYDLLNKKLN